MINGKLLVSLVQGSSSALIANDDVGDDGNGDVGDEVDGVLINSIGVVGVVVVV